MANGDLHLAPGGSAIDAGTPDESVTDDLDGDERSDGIPDIGADEALSWARTARSACREDRREADQGIAAAPRRDPEGGEANPSLEP